MKDLLLQNAYRQHASGNLDEAARLYGEVLRADPEDIDALCLYGMLIAQRGDIARANALAEEALGRAKAPAAVYRAGCLLQILNRHEEAHAAFDRALAANPSAFEVLVHRGISEMALGAHDEAIQSFDAALAVRPREAGVWYNRANALLLEDRREEAVASYDRALSLKPSLGEAWANRAKALFGLERYAETVTSCDKAVAARTGDLASWTLRGLALLALKHFEEALASSDLVLSATPNNAPALLARGQALHGLVRYAEALQALNAYLVHIPDDTLALTAKGEVLGKLGRPMEALQSCERALGCDPDAIEARVHRGLLLADLKRFAEAVADFEAVLAREPEYPFLHSMAAQLRLRLCDWSLIAEDRARIAAGIAAGKTVAPFVALQFSDSPEEQRACAEDYARREHPPVKPIWRGERYVHKRIRLGYVSADFRNHPVAGVLAGVVEQHDRSRFETIAMSLGPDDASPQRRRFTDAFERFGDYWGTLDSDIASAVRAMEIDIAIDLMGYTTGARPGVFAARAAPVQTSYLGFPGTMGVDYIDYLIADPVVIPPEDRRHYREKIVQLPHSFMPGGMARAVARVPPRTECGLPERGFVFACFNTSFKFTPEMFDVWMRLLLAVDGSVLWLGRANDDAERNLRSEARRRGVAEDHLVFAPYLKDEAEYFARLSLADLFLDTLPYNAHSTACDALWCGVPVLTCAGTAFPGRVAASVLKAVGLPELVTSSFSEYESMALALARDPDALSQLKAKLAANRATPPLFDAARLTRHLEAAYETMWWRTQSGLPPDHFTVAP